MQRIHPSVGLCCDVESSWRAGAVLIPIVATTPRSLVFVERAAHLRRHPGQIGFPGGMEEPIDGGDPANTALRELSEELGIGANHVEVVGRLPSLRQALNRFVITPVVGVLRASTRFSIDGDEIVGVFTVPLASLVTPGAINEGFDHEGRHIWGFTARILRSFAESWSGPDTKLRDAAEAALRKGENS